MARKTKMDVLIGELKKIPGCIEERKLSPAMQRLVDRRQPLRWDTASIEAEMAAAEALHNDPDFLAYCERMKRSKRPL